MYMLMHGGQRAHTSCVPSAHHPCLPFAKYQKLGVTYFPTVERCTTQCQSSGILEELWLLDLATAERLSSQFVDRKAPIKIVL